MQFSRAQSAQKDDTTLQFVIFQAGVQSFAVEINRVKEILRYRKVTPLPRTPPFLEGVIGDKNYYQTCDAMFVCGTPLESSAGMDGLVRGNFAKSKELLKEAGYGGTPIVMLHTTDIAVLTNAGPIAKDLLEKGGFKVEMVPLDF